MLYLINWLNFLKLMKMNDLLLVFTILIIPTLFLTSYSFYKIMVGDWSINAIKEKGREIKNKKIYLKYKSIDPYGEEDWSEEKI